MHVRRLLCLLAFATPQMPTRAGAQEAVPSQLSLERIITGNEFQTEGFGPARWLDGGIGYTTLERPEGGRGRDLVRYDPGTGERKVLVAAAALIPAGAQNPISIEDYAWSGEGRKLLIFTNTRRVWRQNTRGDYWVYSIDDGSLHRVGAEAPEASLMFAKFSPDGARVAFVRDANIYVQSLPDGPVIPLTSDGSSTVINGTFDWVYEEELSLRDGFRWSPDGASIAFWQIDTEGMKDYILVNTTDDLYPRLTTIRYPKVGQTNPKARLGVVGATGGATRWMQVPGDPRDNYIARMEWSPTGEAIILQQLNRLQNTNRVMLSDAMTGAVSEVLIERDDAWVDVTDDFRWIEGGERFLWMSERDGWRHLYAASRGGGEPKLVTPGDFDVIEVVRADAASDQVDFIASPDDPKSRYLYRGSLSGEAPATRLTPSDQVGTHSYQIAPDGRWAIHTHSRFDMPPKIDLVSLPDHRSVRTLVNNTDVGARLAALDAPPVEFFRVPVTDGTELDGWCLKPPRFDAHKKYPVLIHVYGEPAGQTVLDQWGGRTALWHRMLAQQGYVVLSVDNRGTPAPRGRAWRKSIYRQIGILASRDQAEAVRELLRRWTYLDPERVGVWGWSGGGSMTLNAMFRYPDLYKAGIAIAFISDQRLYDTIYQERYMGVPESNVGGYRDGSPITHAAGLRGDLLIIHGTGDDNCHYQSCERLIDRLVALNKPFSMLAYPNRSHGIFEGEGTTLHLYSAMTRFLHQSLPPGPR